MTKLSKQQMRDLGSDFLNYQIMDRLQPIAPPTEIILRYGEIEVTWIFSRAIIRLYIELEDGPCSLYGIHRPDITITPRREHGQFYDEELLLTDPIPDDFIAMLVGHAILTVKDEAEL